jgi:hypothetical protein
MSTSRMRSLCSSHAFSSIKPYIKYAGRSLILSHHSSAAGKALYSLISSCFALTGCERISSILSVPYFWIRSSLSCLGQCSKTWRTVCACHPQGHNAVVSGTWTSASQALRPMISVRIRKSAVASAFVRLASKVHILVSTMSSLAILDHQPSFQSIWPLRCVIPSQVLPFRRFTELTDYACSRGLTGIC